MEALGYQKPFRGQMLGDDQEERPILCPLFSGGKSVSIYESMKKMERSNCIFMNDSSSVDRVCGV